MNKRFRILVSGGGIAGMGAVHWLRKIGADVTVVDHAHRFEPLGHYVSLKSHGLELVRELGLLEACRAREARIDTMQAFDARGRLLREGSAAAVQRAVDGYILFRRADLHAALYDAVKTDTDVRFATEIGAVRQAGDEIEVDLPGGSARFDLLVGSDGLHSRTRKLVFGEGFTRPMGGRYIAVTVDVAHEVPVGTMRMFLGRGMNVGLGATSADRLFVIVYHGEGGAEPAGRDPASIRSFLCHEYRDYPRDVVAAFEAIGDETFVFTDTIHQVVMPSIVTERVALVGDAAHCPTFMSGMGSSLALQGARALVSSLEAHDGDVPAALREYDRRIAPIAAGYRDSALKMRHLVLSKNAALATVRDAFIRYTPSWFARSRVKGFYHTKHGPTAEV